MLQLLFNHLFDCEQIQVVVLMIFLRNADNEPSNK